MKLRATKPNGNVIDYTLCELSEPHAYMFPAQSSGVDIYPLSWTERGFVIDTKRAERFTHALVASGGAVFYGQSEKDCLEFLTRWCQYEVEVIE